MNINTPEAKTALDYYTGLLVDGSAVTPDKVDSGWNGEAFGKEKVAMTVEGNWIVPYLKNDFPDVEYAIAELPAGPQGKATMAFTVCYAVPKNANNEGSWALVDAAAPMRTGWKLGPTWVWRCRRANRWRRAGSKSSPT